MSRPRNEGEPRRYSLSPHRDHVNWIGKPRLGRKMVLNPVPVKAANGSRLGMQMGLDSTCPNPKGFGGGR